MRNEMQSNLVAMLGERLGLIVVLGVLAVSGATNGAVRAADVPEELRRYQQSTEAQQATIAAAEVGEKSITPECTQMSFAPTGETAVLSPAKFDQGKPVAGVWVERIAVSGCDGKRVQNIYSIISKTGELKRVAMAPGTTIADPFLQGDAVRYAMVAVGVREQSCKDMKLANTRFDSLSGEAAPGMPPGTASRPWKETWTIKACGKSLDVPVNFAPNARGTSITVDAGAIKDSSAQ